MEEVPIAATTLKKKISEAVMSCFLLTLERSLPNCITFLSSLWKKEKTCHLLLQQQHFSGREQRNAL